jgi:hypothetical protein
MILLLERSGTGYADGQLRPRLGTWKTASPSRRPQSAKRPRKVGVDIDPADLDFTHVVHHRSPEDQGRIGIFFTTARWAGEPVNREPHRCAGLCWPIPPASRPAPCPIPPQRSPDQRASVILA